MHPHPGRATRGRRTHRSGAGTPIHRIPNHRTNPSRFGNRPLGHRRLATAWVTDRPSTVQSTAVSLRTTPGSCSAW